MKLWEILGEQVADDGPWVVRRKVRVLGDDEDGYIVALEESFTASLDRPFPPGAVTEPASVPGSTVVFLYMTRKQIREMLL